MVRRRRLLGGLSLTPVLVGGCGQILGLDGDSILGGAIPTTEAGAIDAATSDVAPPPTTKECDGKPVGSDDPQFGCDRPGCEPCSFPFVQDVKCVSGACAVATCQPGRADCNGKSDDGCEADLLAAATCGSCTTSCPPSAPLCGTSDTIRCLTACPDGQMQCGTSCVDTKSSVEHCGDCSKKCPSSNAPLTDPVCSDGQCAIKCQGTLSPCNGTNPNEGCGTVQSFYRDGDEDSWGNAAEPLTACRPPTGYVSNNRDCHDGNRDVHPGQLAYFGQGYATSNGGSSYDYDCSGREEEDPAFVRFSGCNPPACTGGHLPKPGSHPPEVNPYCGSTTFQGCSSGSGSSSASGSTTTVTTCYSQSAQSTPPVPCH